MVRAAALGARHAGGRVRVDLHPGGGRRRATRGAARTGAYARSRVLGPSALLRCRARALPAAGRGHRAAAPLGNPLGLAGAGPRPRHPGRRARLRLLRRAVGRGVRLRQQRGDRGWTRTAWPGRSSWLCCSRCSTPPTGRPGAPSGTRSGSAHADIYRRGGASRPRRCLTAARCCTWSSDPKSTGWSGTPGAWPRPAVTCCSGPSGRRRWIRDRLTRAAVVHLPFTERLFAPTAEAAAAAYETVVAPALAAGVAISVTLHDLPNGSSPLQERRRAAYDRVVAAARGIVVNSRLELELVAGLSHGARSLRMIPAAGRACQISQAGRPPPRLSGAARAVAVLGFLFPDRGYEQVIAALPRRGRSARAGPTRRRPRGPARRTGRPARPRPGTRCGSPASCPTPIWPAGCARRRSRSRPTLGSAPRPPSPPGSGTAAGRSCRTPRTAGSWPSGPPARSPSIRPTVPSGLRAAIEAALDRAGVDLAQRRRLARSGSGRGGGRVRPALRRLPAGGAASRSDPAGGPCRTTGGTCWPTSSRPEPPAVSVVRALLPGAAPARPGAGRVVRPDPPGDPAGGGGRRRRLGHPAGPGRRAGLATRLVRQPDRGSGRRRPATSGAAAAGGEVLLFLDGDTVPEPDYVRRLARLPGPRARRCWWSGGAGTPT